MAVSDYLKGTGSQVDPYLIHTKAAFIQWFTVEGRKPLYAEIVANIDLGNQVLTAGSQYGHLNGNGHTLKGFYVNTFFYIYGSIKNLAFEGVSSNHPVFIYAPAPSILEDVEFKGPTNSEVRIYAGSSAVTRVVASARTLHYGLSAAVVTRYYVLPGSGDIHSSLTGATDLRTHPTPYAKENYPALLALPDLWEVDGISPPRLKVQDVSHLTGTYIVRGKVTVGGTAKSRKVLALHPTDFYRINETMASEDGSFTLPCGFYRDGVMVATFDQYGEPYQAAKAYKVGDIIHPDNINGYRYVCSVAGTSAGGAPANWPSSGPLVLGAATFLPEPMFEPRLHGPIKPVMVQL
ncbi:hypothetical protein [Aeromonas sp. 102P]|uniref:hypothetical protein n=1 Tax=Aeromonas sp. 102P TaxID=3452711 RepID=UPI003F7B32AE